MWVIFLRAGAVLPFIAILGESGPLFEVRWDVKRFEGLFKRVTPCHVGAAQRPGVRHPSAPPPPLGGWSPELGAWSYEISRAEEES